MKIFLKSALLGSFLVIAAFQTHAAVILGSTSCALDTVTAAGNNADACEGLFAKSKGNGAGPNDSESFLNNALTLQDGSGVWGSEGAFGFNDWSYLGKDDFNSFDFLDANDGSPGTWTLDDVLSGSFVIAVKQAKELGLWYFDSLTGLSSGTFDYSLFENEGWSHIAIYSRGASVPEPPTLILLFLGIAGLIFARKRS